MTCSRTQHGLTILDYIYLFLMVLYPPKFMINAITLILILQIFLFWMAIVHVAPPMECTFLNLNDLIECEVT